MVRLQKLLLLVSASKKKPPGDKARAAFYGTCEQSADSSTRPATEIRVVIITSHTIEGEFPYLHGEQ
jgi:hypothetical protein